MKRSRVVLLWLAAIVITVGSAAWQRRTGPSYPVRGTAMLGGESISYRLLRSQVTGEALPVRIRASAGVTGEVAWRRYPSDEPLQPDRRSPARARSSSPPCRPSRRRASSSTSST